MSNFAKKIAMTLMAALFVLDAVAPAAAQPWGRPPPPPPPGWGGSMGHDWRPPPPPRWRRHCWYEQRRVRVHTPWGPRWRTRSIRVCR